MGFGGPGGYMGGQPSYMNTPARQQGFGAPPPMGGFGPGMQQRSSCTGNNKEVEFGRRLGRGQFGEVFEAQYKGKTVAAKTTGNPTGFPADEIAILRQMQSEHVAVLVGEEKKTPKGDVILMKLYAGSLDDVIQKYPKGVPTEIFFSYLEQITRGLHYFHMQDIIFNDLKPDNLLIDPDTNKVVFADFGDARRYDPSQTRPAGNPHELGWGSPHYHCRPDVMAQMLSTKSDMWMLAQLACHMWTGKMPSTNPGKLPTSMPLFELFERCLSDSPKDRPSAATVLGAIRQELRATTKPKPQSSARGFGKEKTNASNTDKLIQDPKLSADKARARGMGARGKEDRAKPAARTAAA